MTDSVCHAVISDDTFVLILAGFKHCRTVSELRTDQMWSFWTVVPDHRQWMLSRPTNSATAGLSYTFSKIMKSLNIRQASE